MISRFFIDRPIFAAVLSIVITLAGGIAVFNLPLAMYPQIAPPTVQVDCKFPGASARDVAESVAAPIEQQVNGVEGMLYMSSQCTNDGSYNLTVTFRHGIDLNMAQVLVQNRVALALPLLPDVIKQAGVTARKRSPDIMLAIAINSREPFALKLMPGLEGAGEIPAEGRAQVIVADVSGSLHFRIFDREGRLVADKPEAELPAYATKLGELKNELKALWKAPELSKTQRDGILFAATSMSGYSIPGVYDQLYISNYALMHVREEIVRLPGISDVLVLGQQDYSMRVWIDPEQLASRNLTAGDVVRAIRAQNQPVAAGQIGQPPVGPGQPIQIPIDVMGRLVEPAQFEQIVVRADDEGRVVRLGEVARVTIGPKNMDVSTRVNTRPSVSMAIFQLPDANALATAKMVKAKVEELRQTEFPEGLDYEIRYDTTPYISESILEVVRTLRDAVILVALVVLLFLQNWRSSIIPLIAVPVAIIGTFAVMAAMGFSINNLTLFGLVLAIGIVVDDAIVVVEAVEHQMELGLPPRQATIVAMEQVSGPVVAIGLVLVAVFVPCAFISGIVGQFFRQFALTIAASTVISTINSLTLSPALAALMLRPPDHDRRLGRAPEPLPRIAIAAFFAYFLGYEKLGERFEGLLADRLPASMAHDHRQWLAWSLAVLAGLLAGWLVSRPANRLLAALFRGFNAAFRRLTGLYIRGVGGLLRTSVLALAAYGGLLFLTKAGFDNTPKGFIPSQDMGYLLINVQLPDSASLERTQQTMNKIEQIALKTEGVKFSQTMTGQSLLLSAFGSNFGSMFIILAPYDQRPDPFANRLFRWLDNPKADANVDRIVRWMNNPKPPKPEADEYLSFLGLGEGWLRNQVVQPLKDWSFRQIASVSPSGERSCQTWLDAAHEKTLYGDAIANTLRMKFAEAVPEAMVTVLPPPPVRGVGRAGGFKLLVEDRGDVVGLPGLQKQTEILNTWAKGEAIPEVEKADPDFAGFLKQIAVDPATGEPRLTGMTSVFRANVPQFYIDIDRKECLSKRVAPRDLFQTLQVFLGSLYVNDFNRYSRTWQVIVQADQGFRNDVRDIEQLKVRNQEGTMVPIGALASVRQVNGPMILTRYNMYTAAPLSGSAAMGVSSGDAIRIMDDLAAQVLPESMRIEWTELAYLELQAGNTAMLVFGFAVMMVFLVLAAQYESWALPLAVILVVPLCLLCSIAGVKVANEDINIFTQIGFVVLVGLACKNAILIVEYARHLRGQGETRRQAAL
ncbi:MAG: efflux RND transporter permease subunit, partial [Isosphaeraceae bacterium]